MKPNEIQSEFEYAVQEHADWQITLSDGCVLSARAWIPQGEGPFPAILEFLPYRKRDGTAVRDQLTHPYFAGHGYACFRVDMRGNGDSAGLMEDEYTQQEWDDAIEVINYLSRQGWSNGHVGMMGISWGGFNALQVAALNPEPLKAIVTLCSTVDRYADDIHYKGGCLLNENLGWGATMWSYSSLPPDPTLRENWHELWLERLQGEPFLPNIWLQHQKRDGYWQHGSICHDYGAMKAATLAVGGWGDAYKNAVGALVENLNAPAKGIIGPWVHKYPHFAAPEPRIGFLEEALRWWDRWLKGVETDVENDPDLRVFLMHGETPKPWYESREGDWIGINQYPKPTKPLAMCELPQMIGSPQTTGAASGEYCAIWLGPEMPGDQRVDDAYSFSQDFNIMPHENRIVGRPLVKLRVKIQGDAAQLAVRLCDISPTGTSARITYGVINLSHIPAKNGVIETDFEMDAIAYQLPPGHHLRIAVSNAYWPLLWPVSTAEPIELQSLIVELPLLSEHQTVKMPPPKSAPALELRTIRPTDHRRETIIDHQSGIQRLEIVDDFGKFENLQHGLIDGSVAREKWFIHPDDPLTARGECHWTQEVERDALRLRTESHCAMHCDDKNFYLSAELEAYENDVKIFEKSESFVIPRDESP